MATRRKKSEWEELGSTSREADYVAQSLATLQKCLDDVPAAVSLAYTKLQPNWSRAAKDAIIAVHAPLSAAIVLGKTCRDTSCKTLLRLPEYNAEHVFTRARRLATVHNEVLATAEAVKRDLSRATTGDSAQVKDALDRFTLTQYPHLTNALK